MSFHRKLTYKFWQLAGEFVNSSVDRSIQRLSITKKISYGYAIAIAGEGTEFVIDLPLNFSL